MEKYDFSEMFIEKKGQQIDFEGKKLIMSDTIEVPSDFRVKIRIISTNAEWKQGIKVMTSSEDKKGELEVIGDRGNNFIFWEDTMPKEVEMRGTSFRKGLRVYNAWDTGNGAIEARHYGAAMIKEEPYPGRPIYRYHCSDGRPDANFENIIFEVEIREQEK